MRYTTLLSLMTAILAGALSAQGKVFLTPAEALELAFPKCKVERTKHVLNDAKKKQVAKLAGHAALRSMVFAYQAKKKGKVVGTAYFDRHRVRSKQELVMIVVDFVGKVRRIEVVSFGEPLDYLPRGNFYGQFIGRALDASLSVKKGVRTVVGATLTVNATVAAVRRILATHQVLFPKQVVPPPVPQQEEGVRPATSINN
jgi:hypothetical protein